VCEVWRAQWHVCPRVSIPGIKLFGFNYQIEYKNTKRHTNADSLSRLPLTEPDRQDTIDGEDVFYMSQVL
jgi:hypothetical protein